MKKIFFCAIVAVLAWNLSPINFCFGQDIPASATDESANAPANIQQVQLLNMFYQAQSKTTKLSTIADATKVNNFTLDAAGKVRATFSNPLDLSKSEAVDFFRNISSYLVFENSHFSVSAEFYKYFSSPIDLVFYNLPYVTNPDVSQDRQIMAKSDLKNFQSYDYNGSPQISFTISQAGDYKLLPHLDLDLNDNLQVKQTEALTVSGRISDPGAKISISLNGQELSSIAPAIDHSTGSFSFALDGFIPGANLIEARAQSQYGEVNVVKKVVQANLSDGRKTPDQNSLSPIAILAIILGILFLTMLIWLKYLVKKKKR